MPDLAVFLDTSGASDTRQKAGQLKRILGGEDSFFSVTDHVDEHFAAVQVLKPFSYAAQQSIRNGAAWLFFDGALFGDDPAAHPPEDRKDHDPLAQLLDDLCARDHSRLHLLNGQFNAAVGMPDSKRLTIVTDRLGARPLYHASDGTMHVVASEMKAVVAALDCAYPWSLQGVLELFAFGHNVADSTVLRGITVLPPGSVVVIDENGTHATPYFKYRYRAEPYAKNPAALGERITGAVKQSVPDYFKAPGRKGFFLSGGLDSRIIAGAVEKDLLPVDAFTFGYPESRDVRFAAELSEKLGFTHSTLTYPEIYLSEVIRDVVARTECAAPFYHATSLLFHDRIQEAADAIVVGFCGDVFSGGHLKPAMFKLPPGPELTGLVFDRALCARRTDLACIFHPHMIDHVWLKMVESFRASMESIEDQSGIDTADVWDVENRQRRFTFSAPKVDRRRFEVLAPLLDNRLVDLVLTLPAWARRNQLAYKHAIVKGYPTLQDVPCAATGKPIQLSPFMASIQEFFRLGGRAMNKIASRLGLGSASLGWQFRNIGDEMRRDKALFDECLLPFLNGPDFPDTIFDKNGILALLKAHNDKRTDASHIIGTLLTVAVFSDLCKSWSQS